MIHRTDIDGRHASSLADRFAMSAPGLAKGVIAALADKVRADAQADAGRGYPKLSAAGKRAADALKKAAETIPGRDAPGMERLAAEVGDLRYDALRDAVAGFTSEVSGILLTDVRKAAAFRGAILEAAVAVDRAWELSAKKMGLNLDGTPLPKKPEAPPLTAPEPPAAPKRSPAFIAASL